MFVCALPMNVRYLALSVIYIQFEYTYFFSVGHRLEIREQSKFDSRVGRSVNYFFLYTSIPIKFCLTFDD